MSQTVIKVENLYKEYKLGVINHGTLTHDLQSWWARIRGKEDPNSLISTYHNADTEKESFLALKNISFDIKQGDRVGIIGKNGAGKSTLLKILSKVTSPTRGEIKIKGRVASLLEVGTGFHSELTGRENIYLNGAILGMSRREIDRKLEEIIDFAGVEKHIDTPVKRYSSGMNVRLGFAVAAHLEPEILIVDEVLAVGDAEFQKKALGKMENVSKTEGRTILFVSHNMSAVQKLCLRGIHIGNGEVNFSGSIKEVVDNYLGCDINDFNNPSIRKDVDLLKKIGPKILKVIIFSSENILSDGNVKAGSKLKFEIKLKYNENFKNNFGLLVYFHNADGTIIAAISSSLMYNRHYSREDKICFLIDTTPLIPNRYLISLNLHNHYTGEVFDSWEYSTSFAIVKHDIENVGYNYGTHWNPQFYIHCKWL